MQLSRKVLAALSHPNSLIQHNRHNIMSADHNIASLINSYTTSRVFINNSVFVTSDSGVGMKLCSNVSYMCVCVCVLVSLRMANFSVNLLV